MSTFIADSISLAPSMPAALVPTGGPDCAVFAAWADYKAAHHAYRTGDVTSENEESVFGAAIDEAEARIVAAPVNTLEGIAVKLRWYLQDTIMSMPLYHAILAGEPISPEKYPEEFNDDVRAQAIASLLRDVEQMAATGEDA